MKVIHLLNKIAKGEEVPNKIKYVDYVFEWTGLNYYCNQFDVFLEKRICIEDLNYPVEILEEVEDKEYEDIKELTCDEYDSEKKTINQLIRNQKKIIEKLKGDEK